MGRPRTSWRDTLTPWKMSPCLTCRDRGGDWKGDLRISAQTVSFLSNWQKMREWMDDYDILVDWKIIAQLIVIHAIMVLLKHKPSSNFIIHILKRKKGQFINNSYCNKNINCILFQYKWIC